MNKKTCAKVIKLKHVHQELHQSPVQSRVLLGKFYLLVCSAIFPCQGAFFQSWSCQLLPFGEGKFVRVYSRHRKT